MRTIIPVLICHIFFSCQKEVSVDTNQTTASTFDSLVGKWKYLYDYRLVTTQADTTVVIDSIYSTRLDPFSYLEIKADSSFRWWRSESRSLPMFGGGDGGHFTLNESLRIMKWRTEYYSIDDFVTNIPHSNQSTGPNFRIKYLSNDSMVLVFRAIGPSGTYYWLHDVYIK